MQSKLEKILARTRKWQKVQNTRKGKQPNECTFLGGVNENKGECSRSEPLYFLSIYKIPMFVIKRIDQIRCRFLWQGTTSRKKYSLINWRTACLAKEFGGLGILDIKQMNISLLLRWWWKLYRTFHLKENYIHHDMLHNKIRKTI